MKYSYLKWVKKRFFFCPLSTYGYNWTSMVLCVSLPFFLWKAFSNWTKCSELVRVKDKRMKFYAIVICLFLFFCLFCSFSIHRWNVSWFHRLLMLRWTSICPMHRSILNILCILFVTYSFGHCGVGIVLLLFVFVIVWYFFFLFHFRLFVYDGKSPPSNRTWKKKFQRNRFSMPTFSLNMCYYFLSHFSDDLYLFSNVFLFLLFLTCAAAATFLQTFFLCLANNGWKSFPSVWQIACICMSLVCVF